MTYLPTQAIRSIGLQFKKNEREWRQTSKVHEKNKEEEKKKRV